MSNHPDRIAIGNLMYDREDVQNHINNLYNSNIREYRYFINKYNLIEQGFVIMSEHQLDKPLRPIKDYPLAPLGLVKP